MRSFDPRAWLAWCAAVVLVVTVVDNPVVTIVVAVALAAVAATFALAGPEGRAAALMLKLGLVFLVIRVVLFGLTGHAGGTVLFTTPRLTVGWLGGLTLGGDVTAEVVTQHAAEGLEILALLGSIGVFLGVVSSDRLLRLLPRFLFEAGLVIGIAVAFIPTMLRRSAEIRDAQRLRGARRGVRSLRAFVIPVVAGALERSFALAASMECRGYGRARSGDQRREAAARAAVLAGLVALSAGGGLVAFGRTLPGAPLALAGSIALALGLRALGRAVARTRFRSEPLDAWDRALIAASAMVALGAIAARTLPAAAWYAHPVVTMPEADLRLVGLAAAVAVPCALDAARAARLAQASRANEAVEART